MITNDPPPTAEYFQRRRARSGDRKGCRSVYRIIQTEEDTQRPDRSADEESDWPARKDREA